MARATGGDCLSAAEGEAPVELAIRWGRETSRVRDYFVAFFEAVDADVVAFRSFFAPNTGLPAGSPGADVRLLGRPGVRQIPPQPETTQRPKLSKTPTA